MYYLRTLQSQLRPLLAAFVALMLITVVAYPAVVTGVGQLAFSDKADGSIVERDGVAVGSGLVGQTFTAMEYFWGRPSAAGDGYDASASSGSNLGPTSSTLADRIAADASAYRGANGLPADAPLPADAVTASGSGLDPHISPANARLQVARVATARGADQAAILALVDDHIEEPFLGFIGQERVNVLRLNLALDEEFPLQR
jgi:K+-transporting ATPase ATPase C chain